jgi:hypothetical protein
VSNHEVVGLHLGGGVMLFKNALSLDCESVTFHVDRLAEKSISEHYDTLSEPGFAINPSGHRIPIADLDKTCQRVSRIDENAMPLAKHIEKTFDSLVVQYLDFFPMALPTLWWKTEGHFLKYQSGSELGLHCDNDINYQPGFEPDSQLGIYHVLASIAYVAGEWKGGNISFPYLDIDVDVTVGDVILFPANFLAAHQVKLIEYGSRYAYLTYFGHGSSKAEPPHPRDYDESNHGGQVWMSGLFEEFRSYLDLKYGNDHGDKRLPLLRSTHSSGTLERDKRVD